MTLIPAPFNRRSRAIVVIALALVLALSTVIIGSAAPVLLQISSDPYTNTTSQHRTEVEPDTLSAGSTILSAFQVGRFFDGGASNIGFATSVDAGGSWIEGFLPGTTPFATPAGVYARTSDPTVAFDAKHGVWLISYLGLFPNGNTSQVDVLVSRSSDGLTFGNPVVVNNDGHFNDKNWTVCDNSSTSPFYGNCYTEFDDNSLGDLIQMSTSSDGGQTWGAGLGTTNKAHGIGGQPLVQPNGTVIVPINGFAGRFFFTISAFTSSNGGASWGPTVVVDKVDFRAPAGNLRAGIPLPSAEIDAAGNVYVVWSDCHFEPKCSSSDIVMSTSKDGKGWSKVTRLPLDPVGSGVDHFIPGLAVAVDSTRSGSSAHLALTYYYYPNANCTPATCELWVGSSTSTDGGATWTSTMPVAGPMSLSWLPDTSQGRMVGDYISTSFSGGPAFPAFAVAHAPSGSVFDEAIYTVKGGLSVAAAGIAAADKATPNTAVSPTSSSVTVQ